MGFFSSKQQKDDRANLLDKDLIEKSYETLTQAILGELNIGSQDSKEVVISFGEERTVTFFTDKGVIRAVVDSDNSVNLGTFLYWGALDEELSERVMGAVGDSDLSPYALPLIANEEPEALEAMQKALAHSSLETLRWTQNNFDENTLIRTDFITNPQLLKNIGSFELLPEQIEAKVKELEQNESLTLRSLEIAHLEQDLVNIELTDAYEGVTPEERFVVGAAHAGASLGASRALSSGFVWLNILKALRELSDANHVKLITPPEELSLPLNIEMPQLSEEELFVEAPKVEEELDLEAQIAESNAKSENEDSDDSEWEFKHIDEDSKDDESEDEAFDLDYNDGDFTFEEEPEQEVKEFSPTAYIEEDISELVATVFSTAFVGETAQDIAESNTQLEVDLRALEQNIVSQQANYHELSTDYENRKFEQQLSAIENINSTAYVPEESEDVVIDRIKANNTFFNLTELEVDRHRINEERKSLLNELLLLVSNVKKFEAKELELKILEKLSGINEVENIAFHSPIDEEDELVDETLLEDISEEELESIKHLLPEDEVEKAAEIEAINDESLEDDDNLVTEELHVVEDESNEAEELVVIDVIDDIDVLSPIVVPEGTLPIHEKEIFVYDENSVPLFYAVARKLGLDPETIIDTK